MQFQFALKHIHLFFLLPFFSVTLLRCGEGGKSSDQDEVREEDAGDATETLDSCSQDLAKKCADLEAEIIVLRSSSEKAQEDERWETVLRNMALIAHKAEMLEIYRSGSRDERLIASSEVRLETMLRLLEGGGESIGFKSLSAQSCGKNRKLCATVLKKIDAIIKLLQAEDLDSLERMRLELALSYQEAMFKYHRRAESSSPEALNLTRSFDVLMGFLAGKGIESLTCPERLASECSKAEAEIANLRGLLDLEISQLDYPKASQIAFRINFLSELLGLYRKDLDAGSEEVKNLQKKYSALNFLAENDLKPYSQTELSAVKQVFDEFGDLFISESGVDAEGREAILEVAAKDAMPWAGYWYPSRSDALFFAEESPLRKFDRLAALRGFEIHSAAWEEERFDPKAADWAGLCDAWAMAAIQSPEPNAPLEIEGITFSITDQKALLTKLFEGSRKLMFGSRYHGIGSSDGQFQDIRPEAFHRLAVAVLGENGHSLVIDDDPGYEFWSRPLYRMRFKIAQDPEIANAFLVTAWPFTIANRSDLSEQLTYLADVERIEYTYRLYVDHTQEQEGRFKVIYGEWIGRSVDNHPDMIFIAPPEQPLLQPSNKELAKALPLLMDEFLVRSAP